MKYALGVFFLLLLIPRLALGVGTYSVSRVSTASSINGMPRFHKVTVAWTGDAADGTMPIISVPLYGRLVKVVTNPGTTAPTANYDISLNDPSDAALDAAAGALANRHTSTTEQAYPMIAGTVGTVSSQSPLLAGTYGLAITNNSQAAATGTVEIYLE